MTDTTATDPSAYVPPKVWTWNKPNGGTFANINRPVAGPTHDKELPVGRHPDVHRYRRPTPVVQFGHEISGDFRNVRQLR